MQINTDTRRVKSRVGWVGHAKLSAVGIALENAGATWAAQRNGQGNRGHEYT